MQRRHSQSILKFLSVKRNDGIRFSLQAGTPRIKSAVLLGAPETFTCRPNVSGGNPYSITNVRTFPLNNILA